MKRKILPTRVLAILVLFAMATPAMAMRDPGRGQYADGMNLYQYVRSNPTNFQDPTGLATEGQAGWTGGMVRPAFETVNLHFDAFIPKGLGKPNGLYGAGEWAPEPYQDETNVQINPWATYGDWYFQTDDRTFGEQGTSRLYSDGKVTVEDVGHLKPKEGRIFESKTSGSRRARWVIRSNWLGTRSHMDIERSPLTKATVQHKETVTDINPCVSEIDLQVSAAYPFHWSLVTPSIDYHTHWLVTKNGSNGSEASVALVVEHNKFPDYEGLVNGHLIYTYDAVKHGETGPGILNLSQHAIGIAFGGFDVAP